MGNLYSLHCGGDAELICPVCGLSCESLWGTGFGEGVCGGCLAWTLRYLSWYERGRPMVGTVTWRRTVTLPEALQPSKHRRTEA